MGGYDIATIALIFSSFSIMLTILSVCTQRRIVRNQQYAVIKFTVDGVVSGKVKKPQLRTKGIKRDIANLLDIDHHLVEIEKPRSFKFRVIISINNIYSLEKDYKSVIESAISDGSFGEFFKNRWELMKVPVIKDMEYIMEL